MLKTGRTIRIGGLGPLTLPGYSLGRPRTEGRDDFTLEQLNGTGGVLGKQLTLLFGDTKGRTEAGVAAVERLVAQRVHAFAGEFHSVIADAIRGGGAAFRSPLRLCVRHTG